ncbi:MAG: hypothetical protein R2860_04960 [Desulfobacterales bacterium]
MLNASDPDKDVDGFHPVNVGRLMIRRGRSEISAMYAVWYSGNDCRAGVETGGAEVVVVGRSNIVRQTHCQHDGAERPGANSTVTIVHTRTKDLAAHCKRADVAIVAAGVPDLVKPEWIKPGACVIDVGVNRVGEKISEKNRQKNCDLKRRCGF